jgi:cellulose synthase/poly-beta-1,6-N-acetylglucosamine synthase-like glycosyltransferase
MWLASLHSISFNKRVTKKVNINKNKIGVIYPIYNESPEVLDLVLEKALEVENKLREIKFIFIDDGSKNLDTLESIYNKYNKLFKNAEFIYKSNTGKRNTQYDGFSKLKEYEYIISVDSDTLLNYKAIENAFEYFLQNGFDLKISFNEESISRARKKLSRVFHPDIIGTHEEIL